jgi:hypothetical protein
VPQDDHKSEESSDSSSSSDSEKNANKQSPKKQEAKPEATKAFLEPKKVEEIKSEENWKSVQPNEPRIINTGKRYSCMNKIRRSSLFGKPKEETKVLFQVPTGDRGISERTDGSSSSSSGKVSNRSSSVALSKKLLSEEDEKEEEYKRKVDIRDTYIPNTSNKFNKKTHGVDDLIVFYVDAARYLPENVTISRVSATAYNIDGDAKLKPIQAPCTLKLSTCQNPTYGMRGELSRRENPEFDDTTVL